MSDDDLSKYDKFSFVISSTNYSSKKWDDKTIMQLKNKTIFRYRKNVRK